MPALPQAILRLPSLLLCAGLLAAAVPQLIAQSAAASTPSAAAASVAGPIAIVPIDGTSSGSGASVTGALEVTSGKAIIAASGTVTSGTATTDVMLPHRGTLRVCASTAVKLAADSSAPVGEIPGLMMALDHGAVEASFATGRSADVLLTPDFRILISGPGAADVKVRLGEHGDTCVDNPGADAPYVLVTSVFDGSNYRVQPGQRVMFQHGSVHEVVDEEKEPCGCPPEPHPGTNEFPLAQSAGLAPTPKPKPSPAKREVQSAEPSAPLVFNAAGSAQTATVREPATASKAAAAPPETPRPAHKKKPGFFGHVGHFFRRIFGAE
jgi:hypothetical protein